VSAVHHYNYIILIILKIGNLRKKNRDHKQVPKQDEDTGNLQILLHLRSLFVVAVKIGILNI